MTMYEELVKNLRLCSKCDFGQNCNECTQRSEDRFCCDILLHKAADAIEELQEKIGDIKREKVHKFFREEYRRCKTPKWIPATERLPEAAYGCLVVVDDYEPMTGTEFLNYYPEFVGYDGEQWNDADGEQLPCEVVYWMKMPELPKDDVE